MDIRRISQWAGSRLADLLPLGAKASQGYGLVPAWNMRATWATVGYKQFVSEGYKGLYTVYRCVRVGAENFKQAWIKAVRVVDADRDETDDLPASHPLNRLLRRPNPWMTQEDFLEAWWTYLELSGNAFVEKVREGVNRNGPVVEMWPLRPDLMKVVPDKENIVGGYVLEVGTEKVAYAPDQMMHWRYMDPVNEHVGMSPLQSLRHVIDIQNAAISWNKLMLQNSAVPASAIVVPPERTLSPQQKLELETSLERFSREGMYGTIMLSGGLDWKQLSVSPRDMEFAAALKDNDVRICAVMGTPAIMAGFEQAKYDNYRVARLSFWEEKVMPMLEFLVGRLNWEVAPTYGADVQIIYDVSHVAAMRDAFVDKVGTAKDLFAMGFPINAINNRLELGFEPLPWGDQSLVPSNLIPASELVGAADLGAGQEDEELPLAGGPPAKPNGHAAEKDISEILRKARLPGSSRYLGGPKLRP